MRTSLVFADADVALPPSRARFRTKVLDAIARSLRTMPVPRRMLGARPVLLGHVAARAWERRHDGGVLRRALLQTGFMEVALRIAGRGGAFHAQSAFLPLFLLPNFHGPHFDEALRRLLLPHRGPFMVHLAVTGACPCRCAYCYAEAGGMEAPDLGDDRVRDIARALTEANVPLVILGGGEPTSRFERLVSLIEILAPSSEVRLATSGIGLTSHRAARLRDAGLSVIAVSLDSDDREAVDRARGYEGAFDAAVTALRCSMEAGLITLVTAVVGRDTFGSQAEVQQFLSFVRSIHPELVVSFLPKFAAGRAVADGGFRSPREFAPVARRIERAIARGGYRATTVYGDAQDRWMGCVGAGARQVNVDAVGNVRACVSGAAFGNLVDEPLDAIYGRFAASARLKRGYFCAEKCGGLDARDSARALETFFASHDDPIFQRVLDVAGGAVAWLAES